MNTLQNALKKAFPKELDRIAKEERRKKFEKAAANGKRLLEKGSRAVTAGKPGQALKEVQKDRYACACALAKELSGREKKFVPVRRGFEELESMEKLLALKAAELNGKSTQSDASKAQARKEKQAKELAAQRVKQQEVAVAG